MKTRNDFAIGQPCFVNNSPGRITGYIEYGMKLQYIYVDFGGERDELVKPPRVKARTP